VICLRRGEYVIQRRRRRRAEGRFTEQRKMLARDGMHVDAVAVGGRGGASAGILSRM
jgi:hypothetical protein